MNAFTLANLSEAIQDDLLTLLDFLDDETKNAACQIVVDRIKEVKEKLGLP